MASPPFFSCRRGGITLPQRKQVGRTTTGGKCVPKKVWRRIDTEYVSHYICVMKTRLRNITITLEESIARWARIEAARRDTSISRLLAGILKERMLEEDAYQAAMRRALERKPFLKTNGRYLSREEVHDRPGLR